MPWKKPARKAKKSAPRRRTVKKPALTQSSVHKFKFSPTTQYLRNNDVGMPTPAPQGGLILLPTAPEGPITVLTATRLQSFSTPQPTSSGFLGSYDFGLALNFRLQDCANYGAWTALYDSYRIDSVRVNVRWCEQQDDASQQPTVYAIQDYDDSVVPFAGYILARQGRKVFRFGNKSKTDFSMTVKPRAVGAIRGIINPVTSVASAQSRNQWLDCNIPSVENYGIKMWFENVFLPKPEASSTAFEFTYQYVISFKGLRNQY